MTSADGGGGTPPNLSSSSSSSTSSLAPMYTTNRPKRKSLSTIESCVTRLLVSTKHLLESLTQWARQEVDDKFVSDAYVKLGNDFRSASRAFTNSGIDISDLGNVPQQLRVILEAALAEAPSQENLDRFLPDIRQIIVTLLQNLKVKQAKAKAMANERSAREALESNSEKSRQSRNFLEVPTETASEAVKNASLSLPEANSGRKSNTSSIGARTPERKDALSQLQNGDALQRRASKRFSAYQFAKLTSLPNQSKFKQINEATSAFEPQATPRSPEALPIATTNANANSPTSAPTNANSPLNASAPTHAPTNANDSVVSESNLTTGETYVLLRINSTTRKSFITLPATLASIRLLFVEKFGYSPAGGTFPDIYIEDPHSKAFYELEESLLGDVKTGTLLCLQENTKREEETWSKLGSRIEELNLKLESMSTDLTSKVENAISSIEIPTPVISSASDSKLLPRVKQTASNVDRRELTRLENELRAVKQLNNASTDEFSSTLAKVMQKLKVLQESGLEVSQNANRKYMESCHLKLSEESDSLLTKVDDLQDVMEEVRKDVAQRGVRVGEKQLKQILKEISEANKSWQEMSSYITKEKSIWKKIWESELDKVCEEQQFFNLQDDLTNDLKEDLARIQETYELIEQCSIEQSKGVPSKRSKVVANLHIPEPGESLHSIKDQVLVNIASLNPNHESRVEAIERAEKLREKERAMSRLNKFQEELGDFVEDNRLKKSGGIEEIENLRKQRDQENLKSSFGIV
ncbi:uncharacterized protein LODBEIA_P05500 [Lodderomyces beijingensis]|uniref:Actin interacting protein 3 C-terminal domain-containing protein n=1 Tax=Lodderomyces beijingensis TaxID=1775926 RepID=A0ABP0ZDS8_9ASCO